MSNPPHPADFLNDVLMPATGRSDGEIARLLGISLPTFYTILTREKPISRSTAEMLGRLFQTGDQFWLQMQVDYDRFIAASVVVDAAAQETQVQPPRIPAAQDSPMRLLPKPAQLHELEPVETEIDFCSKSRRPSDAAGNVAVDHAGK